MTISESVIEKIKLSINIESALKEYLPNLKRVGRNWKSRCPFHYEKTPSFVVSSEKGIFKCFGCNIAGDVFKFLMLIENISWVEAVKKLAKKAGIEIPEVNQYAIKISEKDRVFDILENSAEFYHKHLLESRDAKNARDYLERRGINIETINKFKIGFAPKEKKLQLVLKKNYSVSELLKAGLIKKMKDGNSFEYMSERIVFPIFDVQGRIVAFGGRNIEGQDPKYLNTPETLVYSKSSNLFGLFQALPKLRKERKTIVLEGYVDVIILQQFGVVGAVAVLGTAFSKNHAKLVVRYSDVVTLLFDSDAAGRNAAQRALEILINDSGLECTVSSLPENTDADEYINQYGKNRFLKLLEESSMSAIDFMIDRVCGNLLLNKKESSPEIKAKAVDTLLEFIVNCPNFVIQGEWVKNVAQRVNVDEEAVWKEFKKKGTSKRETYLDNARVATVRNVAVNNKIVSMSLEEILLNFILNNRRYIEKIDSVFFRDLRCKKIFELVASGLSDTEVLNKLSEVDESWLLELLLNDIEYDNVEEAFNIIVRDVELYKLKANRKKLEKEILLMDEGKIVRDEKVFEEYKKLTTFLKGSVK
jgi:DNA primase